jgi:hypothetical protein
MRANQRLDQGLVWTGLRGRHRRPLRRHDQLPATAALQSHRDADGQSVELETTRSVITLLPPARALTGDAPLPVTIDDAWRSIELLTAAYHSVFTGEAVTLPITPDHPRYQGWMPTMQREFVDG